MRNYMNIKRFRSFDIFNILRLLAALIFGNGIVYFFTPNYPVLFGGIRLFKAVDDLFSLTVLTSFDKVFLFIFFA